MKYTKLVFITPNKKKKVCLWTDKDLIDFIPKPKSPKNKNARTKKK